MGESVVRCFDARSGHLLRTYWGHEGAVLALHMAKDKIYSATTLSPNELSPLPVTTDQWKRKMLKDDVRLLVV